MQKKRENNYDFLRALSTLAVIIIHINYQYFEKRAYDPIYSFYYCAESILNIITRFSVPIFVMLSGAFILNNKENQNFKYFYKKMSRRIFLPAVVLLVLFFIIDEIEALYTNHSYILPIKSIIIGNYYNLWYLYMLFGLYLLTPFIIRVKNSVEKHIFKISGYVLLLWAIISSATSNFRLAYDIGVVFAFAAYFILGNILYEEKKPISKSGGVF